MDSSSEIKVPASLAMSQLTMHVKVTGLQVLRVRVWLACTLLKVAAFVAGCGIEIEDR